MYYYELITMLVQGSLMMIIPAIIIIKVTNYLGDKLK